MSVADILAQMAANAGRRPSRASVIGNTIADLSQVPGQIMDARARQRVVDEQRARQQGQDARQARGDARDEQTYQTEQQQQAIAHHLMTVYTAGSPNDPSTNDLEGAIAEAKRIGAVEWIPKLQKIHADELAAANPKPYQTDPTHDTRDPRTNAIITPAVPKVPEMGTPAHEVYLRQQTLMQPSPLPDDGVTQGPQRPAMTADAAAAQAYDDQRAATGKTGETHSPIYKEWQDHKAAGGTLSFDAYMNADANRKRPVVNVSGMTGMYNATDPAAIAAQIRAGQMPPDITQYGRPVQGAIASVLAKAGPNGEKPFNLAAAQREWKAQLKLNSTMNGPQQVRLDESIRSGLAMYDKVDELAAQWDGMGIGPLSRANLAAAKNGLKGAKAASIANQLSGQIGQLTSDIATIEQGGLTPTNEARAVAEKSMQDWWGKGTINDMTAQGRYNMQIRHTARNTQEPMTPGNGVDLRPAQPATPAAAAPALRANTTQRVVQNGVTYEVTTDAAGKVISSKAVR